MKDAIVFWLGKVAAELVLFLGVSLVCVAWLLWISRRKR
jgi:hypothetical protein